MKRLVSFLLVFLSLISLIPIKAIATDNEVVFAETYEDVVTHSVPLTGEFIAAQAYVNATKERNKELRMSASDEDYIKVLYKDLEIPERFVFSADISVSGRGSTGELSFLSSNGSSIKFFDIRGDEGIANPDGHIIGGFSGNKQRIDIVYNSKIGVYSIYFDGVCRVQNYYLKTPVTDITGFQLILYPKDGVPVDVTLDNVYIYEGMSPMEFSKLPKKEYNEDSIALEENNDSEEAVYFIRDFDELTAQPFRNVVKRINSNSESSIDVAEESNGNKYIEWVNDSVTNRLDINMFIEGNYTYEKSIDKRYVIVQMDILKKEISGALTFSIYDANRAHGLGFDAKATDSGIVVGKTNAGSLYADKWVNLAFALDQATKTYDIYVNYELVKEKIAFSSKDFGKPSMLYINGNNMHIGLDSFAIYSGKKPKPMNHNTYQVKSVLAADRANVSLLKTAEVLNFASKRLYYNGEVVAEGDDLFIERDSKYYLNVEVIGKMYGKTIEVSDNRVRANGVNLKKSISENGKTYAAYDELFSAFGKNSYYDPKGMVIAYNGELDIMSWGVLGDYGLWNIYDYTAYDRPSPEQLLELFNEKSKGKHPRLIHSSEDVEEIKELAQQYDEIKVMLDAAIKTADGTVGAAPIEMDYSNDCQSARALLRRITNCGTGYLFTHDTKYAEQVWNDIKYVIDNWGDWRPLANLSHSETLAAVSIGYDWCYDYFTPEQHKLIENTLKERCLHNGYEVYYGIGTTAARHYVNYNGNQNPVGHGGYTLGAVVLMDTYPEESAKILSQAIKGIESFNRALYPGGAFQESLTYWVYAMQYYERMVATLDVTFGTDFGVLRGPDFTMAPYYILHASTRINANAFHDGGGQEATNFMGPFGWLSHKLDDPELMNIRLAFYKAAGMQNSDLWYTKPENLGEESSVKLDLDGYFPNLELVSMRSDWLSENATWISFHGGDPSPGTHGHVDSGTYVFNMLGERWVTELTLEDYAFRDTIVEKYRDKIQANGRGWTASPYIYTLRPEGHDCIVINPDFEAGQDLHNWSYVTKRESKTRGAYAVLDLSDTYYEDAISYLRGYMLGDDRRSVQIRDEIKVRKPDSDVYSFMYVYNTDVEIINERTAILTKNGKQIKLEFVTNGGRDVKFTVGEAKPLETSPQDRLVSTEGYTKITINMKVDDSAYIHIRYLPLNDPKCYEPITDLPISQWVIPDGEIQKLPAPDVLYKNGEPVESFSEDAYNFVIKHPEGKPVPKITADISGIYDYELKQAESITDSAVLKLWLKSDPSCYSIYNISFEILPKLDDFQGYARPQIYEIYSNDIPQPANGPYNLIDGDTNTTHAMNNPMDSWTRFDLGQVTNVDAVAMAVNKGDTRINWFRVEVSEDGKNWKEVYKGQSSGTTIEPEIYTFPRVKARYVRLFPEKSTGGTWVTTTEFYPLQSK